MATRKVGGGGGRLRLALFLLCFLVISGGVILRRSFGISASTELRDLEAKRSALIAERLHVEAEIRSASSRARIQPIAEQKLNMHVAVDSQLVILSRIAP
ncbi:MAG: cell division protein FtsL family protein [Gemmatimonadetes bacterium]|nr:cell division protein FtsL family protein [Gemmatimonadota bacterium]